MEAFHLQLTLIQTQWVVDNLQACLILFFNLLVKDQIFQLENYPKTILINHWLLKTYWINLTNRVQTLLSNFLKLMIMILSVLTAYQKQVSMLQFNHQKISPQLRMPK